VHGMRGWIQGYNAQAACNEQHLILTAEIMTASPDFGHLGPMVTAARRELTAAGVTAQPEVVVADAGYRHIEQINEITADGIPVLVPPDSSRRRKPRPGWTGGAFGHTKYNRRFDRFHRRGRSAARTEWRLIAATDNVCKLHQHFTAAIA
jgi:hypothetical protein